MRVLVVATEILLPDHHGGSTHVLEVAAHLAEHADTLVLARRGSQSVGRVEVVGVGRPMRRFPAALRSMDALRDFPRAFAAARAFAPDVIYERGTSYGLGAMLSAATGAPLVTMVLDQRYSWLSLLRATQIVATRLDIVPTPVRAKAVAVSWGANHVLFQAGLSRIEARARLGLGDAFVVGYSGSFKAWHGLDDLLRAAQRLHDRNIRYLLIGDGPERRTIEREARARGIHHAFHFSGAVGYQDVPKLLAAADVCVAPFHPSRHGPSRRRGFILDPLKVFEYLALGKPTITIRSPNIEVLFQDGEHLLLVTPGRDAELAQAIERLQTDPELARNLASAGRSRVLQRHTWAAHASQLMGIFRGTADRRGPL